MNISEIDLMDMYPHTTWVIPTVIGLTESTRVMATSFNSTSFFLSKWAEDKPKDKPKLRRVELDIVEDPSVREVCQGNECSLYYDRDQQDYITAGSCERSSLCTETRIVKDSLFLKTGSISNTNHCVNYDNQLNTWNK